MSPAFNWSTALQALNVVMRLKYALYPGLPHVNLWSAMFGETITVLQILKAVTNGINKFYQQKMSTIKSSRGGEPLYSQATCHTWHLHPSSPHKYHKHIKNRSRINTTHQPYSINHSINKAMQAIQYHTDLVMIITPPQHKMKKLSWSCILTSHLNFLG